MRLLLVDDSRVVHHFVKECLDGSDHELDHAYNGKEAIQKVESEKYDAVLLDWEMPVMDGPTFVQEATKMKIGIPIIMLTSKNALDDVVKMLESGVSEYIMKPFTQDILFEKLEFVLGRPLKSAAA